MVTVKSKTIKTAKFETEIIKAIKTVKGMKKVDKNDVLELLRVLHNDCLEWVEPKDDFEIIKELRV